MAGLAEIGRVACFACVIAGLSLVAPPAAGAAFPGSNGPIAFWTIHGKLKLKRPGETGSTTVARFPRNFASTRPGFSPNGRRLVFSIYARRRGGVWIVRADGRGRPRRIARSGIDPSFSPDGKRILFANRGRICTMKRDGTGRRCLTKPRRPAVSDSQPVYFPDGSRIVFNRGGAYEHIMIMRADGRRVRALTPRGSATTDPDVSPDGRWIAYSHYGTGRGIYLIRPDGTGRHRVLRGRCERRRAIDGAPSFSPNGRRLAFTRDLERRCGRDRPYISRLLTMRLDGRRIRTVRKSRTLAPSWGAAPRRR